MKVDRDRGTTITLTGLTIGFVVAVVGIFTSPPATLAITGIVIYVASFIFWLIFVALPEIRRWG